MKKAIKYIHLVLSLPAGIVLTIICLTGAILVFDDEINQLINPSLYYVEKTTQAPLPLNQLIDMITNSEVEKIVILYKDRLLSFGFEMIENLCNKYGTTIEIIDNTEKTEEQELVEDLIQIVTVFSCRLQGKRANKAKKMIKELLENDIGEES